MLTLTAEDYYNVIRYILNLRAGKGQPDDIDHLENRRVRTIKDLVMDEFRKGMIKLRRSVRERMSLKDAGEMTPAHADQQPDGGQQHRVLLRARRAVAGGGPVQPARASSRMSGA